MLGQGQVALSIADEAYKVAFYIAFDNGTPKGTMVSTQRRDCC